MKKSELEKIRNNVQTGQVFNRQLITTQVETIYSLDKLRKQLKKLNKSIDDNNKKSEELGKSNQKLQIIMFLLALVTTAIAIFQISEMTLREMGYSGVSLLIRSVSNTLALTGLLAFFIEKQIKKWE